MHPFSALLSSIVAPAHLQVLPGGAFDTGGGLSDSGSALSDADLVGRIRKGERGAGQLLVSRHLRPVLLRTERLIGRGADAEDVVQDAFCHALRDLARLKEPQRFGAWVQKIAVRQVHRRFRRRKLLQSLGLVHDIDDRVLSDLVSDQVDPSVRAQLSELDALLVRRPARERLCWMLRHVEGLELSEVAFQVGCSLATAKRDISRVQQETVSHWGEPLFREGES